MFCDSCLSQGATKLQATSAFHIYIYIYIFFFGVMKTHLYPTIFLLFTWSPVPLFIYLYEYTFVIITNMVIFSPLIYLGKIIGWKWKWPSKPLYRFTRDPCLYTIWFPIIYWINTLSLFFYFNWVCLGVWLWLFFKVFFIQKYIKMIFFLFLKIIFKINVSKWSENIKKIIFNKNNFWIFW